MRFDGLRVAIYPNDHRPAHVHVHLMGGGHEAVFRLRCPHGPPELRENHGFRPAELAHIHETLTHALAELCEAWRHWHDDY